MRLKWASHGGVSFKHIEHTFWQKVRAYLSCIAGGFLAVICFVYIKGAPYRDVSVMHT